MNSKRAAIRWSLAALAAVSFIGMTGRAAQAAFSENFNGMTSGSLVTSQPNWSVSNGTNSGTIITSGYDSTNGLSVANGYSKYQRTLTGDEIATYQSGPVTFRTKLTFNANDEWTESFISIAKTGGVSGLNIMFVDSGVAGTADNFIRVSNGGNGLDTVTYTTLLDAQGNIIRWTIGVWYEVVVHDIVLKNTGIGKDITAKVDLYGNGVLLASDVAISGAGNYLPFDKIDALVVGGYRVTYDDMSLAAVPEPAALGILCMGLATATFLKKR